MMDRPNSHPGLPAGAKLLVVLLFAALPLAIGGHGYGQIGFRGRIAGQDDPDKELIEGVFLPIDRDTTRQLQVAKDALEQNRYSDAATVLDGILQRSEDFFFRPDENKPIHRSLKAEAQRLIGSMPPEGLQAYELQFGARAQQMLQQAAGSGDVPRLEEVARRFFHTQAGHAATFLLGRHHLDHGRPLAAALCFQRLTATPAAAAPFEPAISLSLATAWLQSGMSDRASEVLVALKKQNPKAAITIGQQTRNLPTDDTKLLPWLVAAIGDIKQTPLTEMEYWALFRGNPARNATSAGGSPLLNPRWRVPTTNHPALEKSLVGIRQRYVEQGIAALPSMHPLAVGDTVLMRTARDLLAVDFRTGKRVWEVRPPGDSSVDRLLNVGAQSGSAKFDPQMNPAITERFWDDATFGTLASDGQQVYLIEDLGYATGNVNQRIIINNNGTRRGGNDGPKTYNKLSARELRTQGKLKWEIGGTSGEDEPQLAGAFFLGPPLPLQGRLYILAEIKGEIKLCVLDSKTGKLGWSQQLAVVEQNILQDPFRRLAGSTPSYADGVLVCPTSAGAVVAVDLANRSLLWGYQYPRNQPMMQNALQMMRMGGVWVNGQFMQPGSQGMERWTDAAATIADGRVIITPVESNELHCLSLLDGKLLWKKDRGDSVYLACINNGNAIMAGKRQVTAYKTADGSEAWKSKGVDLPATAMPSGRGFMSGDDYYLPLTTAEVARVNLKEGKITARAKSRKGNIPGNLICYQGEVVSQGVDFLETFYQLEPLQQRIAKMLAEQPKDAWALAHRGEIALDEGRLPEAISDIRQSHQIEANPFTRDLLIEALLAALDKDFAKHRDALPELESLVKLDSERSAYFRVLARGLHNSGETLAALDAYMQLAKMDIPSEDLEHIDPAHSVRRDRWIRAQFNELFDTAKDADREQIEAAVRERLDADLATKSAKSLRHFLALFGDHPLADEARDLLVDQIGGPETLLEREQLLRQLERSPEAPRRKSAMVKLAALLRDAGRADEALACYHKIKAEFGDEPVMGEKNVAQIIAALPADSPLRKAEALATSWPTGKVEVKKESPRGNSRMQQYMRAFPMDLRGDREPFFRGMSVAFDQQRQDIVGRDGWGNERFRVSLNEGGRSRNYPFNPSLNYALSHNHLLIVSMGFQVFGIDTLRASGVAGSRILWTHDLSDQPMNNPYGYNGMQVRQVAMPWGAQRFVANIQNQQLGNVGACSTSGVCIQRARDVSAIDPISGQTLWVRHGVSPGSDLFGDEELVIVAPSDGTEALVLRALDGQLLGKRKVPAADVRWTTLGRNLLAWRTESGGKLVLAMHDVWDQREIWSETFAPGSKGTIVEGESVAVLEPSGRFVVIDLADGRKSIDEKLEAETSLQQIQVLCSEDRLILMTSRPFTNNKPNRNIQSPFGDMYCPMINGRVYAFDRTSGKPAWAAPATVEQHGLVLGQGVELPALVFIRNVHSAEKGRASMKGEVLALDKRTGRLIDDAEVSQMISAFEVTSDREKKTITLATPVQNIVLHYTSDDISPEPPFQAALMERPAGVLEKNPAGALIRAFGGGARVFPGGGVLPEGVQPFGRGVEVDVVEEVVEEVADEVVKKAAKAAARAAAKAVEAAEKVDDDD